MNNQPRRPTGSGAQTQFFQAVHDKSFSEHKLIDSPDVVWIKTTRGIQAKLRNKFGTAQGARGFNIRGAWTRDTTYEKNDLVGVMERLGYAIDVAGNIEPRFFSWWYWPHDTDSQTEPSANPNCPTIVAPFMDTDTANWPFVYNENSPGATIYSEGDARGTPFSNPIAPPDPQRSWNLFTAMMLPLNWGSGLTVVIGGHTLRFCNGILVGDST